MDQRTPEWFAARLGRVTASKIDAVMAKGRGGAPSSTRANYLAQIIAERLSGVPYEGHTSHAMQHGTETEPQARANYALATALTVEEVGFVPHPTIAAAGASPDGLVGSDGLVEIKCPNTANHIATLRGAPIDGGYLKQMQFQMACTGRAWCDFVSFDPRMPEEMQIHIRRVHRDPEMIVEIETAVREFLAEADATVSDLLARFPSEEAA